MPQTHATLVFPYDRLTAMPTHRASDDSLFAPPQYVRPGDGWKDAGFGVAELQHSTPFADRSSALAPRDHGGL